MHPAHLTVDHACLIVHGSDKPGIVAAVSAMITRIGGNIVAFDQFSDDHRGGAYFQRVVFHRDDFAADRPAIEAEITATLGDEFCALYKAIKRDEVETFLRVISPWERDHLLLNV